MSKNTKIVIGILLAAVIVIGIFAIYVEGERAKQTERTVATVSDARIEKMRKGKNDTNIGLSFTAAGRPASGRARVKGEHLDEWPTGKQVEICYDPAKTDSLRIADGPCPEKK